MMKADAFQESVERVAREGPRHHARWDSEAFAAIAAGPAQTLWQEIAADANAGQVLAGYLDLVQEGIGAGYLRGSDLAQNFLARCLLDLAPRRLAALAPGRRLEVLAMLWNLGEGLLREPAWLDRYVSASAASLDDLEQVEKFLVDTLQVVLTPSRAVCWDAGFDVAIVDARPVDDEFLPGKMHLAAPSVVCVHDEHRAGVHMGLLLQAKRKSRFLGVMPCLGEYPAPRGVPPVSFSDRLRIGGQDVDLSFLRVSQQQVIAESGFVVASAVDSQRLWIVESA